MPTLKLKGGRFSPIEASAEIEVTLEEYRAGARPGEGRYALLLPNDADLAEAAEAVKGFPVVIVEFPTFKDGRAYSQARLLRERYGYRGEIRARGDVLRDQVLFMTRAGIDAVEVDPQAAEGFAEALGEFAFFYQTAADGAAPVWRRRTARAAAA